MDENGNIKFQGEWSLNIPIGTFVLYFDNGVKKSELTYLDGKLDGKSKIWYDNGMIAEEVKYKNGKITKRKCFSLENKKIECSEEVFGCIDSYAKNYNSLATFDCCCDY